MVLRVLIAIFGAGLITATMLYGMSEFTSLFRHRPGAGRYFAITDILPAPPPGRPTRPPDAALPPTRAAVQYHPGKNSITVDVPADSEAGLKVSPEAVPPTLDDTPDQN